MSEVNAKIKELETQLIKEKRALISALAVIDHYGDPLACVSRESDDCDIYERDLNVFLYEWDAGAICPQCVKHLNK
jgi:hypothetical protein